MIKAQYPLIACLLFVFGCGTADQGNPGFYLMSHDGAPAGVRAAAPAVYRMVVFPPENEAMVARENLDVFMEQLTAKAKDGTITDRDLRLIEVLAESLRQSGDDSANFGLVGVAVGFLHGDQTSIWTNRHNLQFFNLTGEDKRVDIVLIDTNERVVFDGRKGKDSAVVELLGSADAVDVRGAANVGVRKMASDVARLRLSRPLEAQPLIARSAPAVENETVYVLGFPSERTGREIGESRGNVLRYSYGRILKGLTKSRLYGADIISKDDPDYGKWMIDTTADGTAGHSGAPMLDASGKLIAITTSGVTTRQSGAATGIRCEGWGSHSRFTATPGALQ